MQQFKPPLCVFEAHAKQLPFTLPSKIWSTRSSFFNGNQKVSGLTKIKPEISPSFTWGSFNVMQGLDPTLCVCECDILDLTISRESLFKSIRRQSRLDSNSFGHLASSIICLLFQSWALYFTICKTFKWEEGHLCNSSNSSSISSRSTPGKSSAGCLIIT